MVLHASTMLRALTSYDALLSQAFAKWDYNYSVFPFSTVPFLLFCNYTRSILC